MGVGHGSARRAMGNPAKNQGQRATGAVTPPPFPPTHAPEVAFSRRFQPSAQILPTPSIKTTSRCPGSERGGESESLCSHHRHGIVLVIS